MAPTALSGPSAGFTSRAIPRVLHGAHTPQHWCHYTVTLQSLILDKMIGLSTAQEQCSCWVYNIL